MKKFFCAVLVTGTLWGEPLWTPVTPPFPVVAPSSSWIEVEVQGPPDVSPAIEGPGCRWELQQVSPGRYRGRIQPCQGELRIGDQILGSCQVSSGLLGVFEVTRPLAVFRSGPSSDYDRLTPLMAGVRLEVCQRQGDYLQVKHPSGWVKLSEGRLLPASATLGGSCLSLIRVTEPAHQVEMRLGSPCAWQIRGDVEGRKLWVDLPNVPSALFHVAYPQKTRGLSSLRVWSRDQGSQVEIPLGHRLWGYQARWSGSELQLKLTPAPVVDPRRPLKGLRVTLDAGHGGEDSGTVGLELGVKEKDLNLKVATALQKELQKGGAVVTMTRSQDRQVAAEDAPADQELQARVEVAEASRAQLFISVHHNAMPDTRDGRVSHGTHVYYFQPWGRGLAQAVAEPLARALGEPEWKYLWRSFHVIRQTSMPAVLVEVNFLSNPGLEKGMMSAPDYPQKAARGIRQGVERFLRSDM